MAENEQTIAQREQVEAARAKVRAAIPPALLLWMETRGWPVSRMAYFVQPHQPVAYLIILATAIVFYFVIALPLHAIWHAATDYADADVFNKFLLALGGLIGAPLVVWRVMIAHRANHIAQENLYTTLLTKAVEQLGATREEKTSERVPDGEGKTKLETSSTTVPNTEVRLGAIYALEKLAADYEPLHWPIMEILCAYVRKNAGPAKPCSDEVRAAFAKGWSSRTDDEEALLAVRTEQLKPPFVDVQAALTVIGRRSQGRIKFESEQRGDNNKHVNASAWRLDFSGCHLAKAQLEGLNFAYGLLQGTCLEGAKIQEAVLIGARLYDAHLEGAQLDDAHFEQAGFDDAHLEGAHLFRAHLEGAWFSRAYLEGASLNEANLEWAYFHVANLEGASIFKARLIDTLFLETMLKGATGLSEAQLDLCWGDELTRLPEGLTRPVNDRWDGSEDPIGRWHALRDLWLAQAKHRKV